MTDKNKKLLIIILSAIVVALAVALTVVLVMQGGSGVVDSGEHPEQGIYYYDSGTQEYTLTLSQGNRFTLYVKGGTESGTYTLADKALTLDFSAEGVENIEATLENNVVTLTFNGATMRFLKKVTYTVSFESNGGSSVQPQTVLNGKTLSKPEDPVREGQVFVGWYVDSEFKTPFAFDAQPVTADLTLYARWCEELIGGAEYTVDFDLNYEFADNPDSVRTSGGKLFGLPVVTREGYEFMGWWVSMSDNGEKLTYRYEEGMQLTGNTLLFAVWQSTTAGTKLAAPMVNVASGSINWNSIAGARSYTVSVYGPNGEVIINNESTSATTFNIPFDTYAEGEYEIRVTALATTGDADNAESVRYYINKALGKVSQFEVIDSMLIFNMVENAQKYLITVVCGNAEHQHTLFDNGTSRTFNFANCDMPAEGIRFTVTAVAEGYGSTTSREFVYRRALESVEGLRYDEATQSVVWNEVPNAAWYMVSVECGNADHDHSFRNVGGQTSISLKECDAREGGIVVKVYPKTRGYHSPAATELTVNKKGPATPSDIRLIGTVLSWNAVAGAEKYEVQIGDMKVETAETSLNLADSVKLSTGTKVSVSIRSIGAGESAWSDVRVLCYLEMSEGLRYDRNTLYWQPVAGATGYEVQINDGQIITVNDGTTQLRITLTQAGTNVLKVRFLEDEKTSDWAQMEVFAHEVVFDTRGGDQIESRYLAVGDLTELPTTSKEGYHFAAWYNVPGGPAANGYAYTDELFAENGGMVLYAHYAPNTYKVTYNYGTGGTGDVLSDNVLFERDYVLTVPVPASGTGAFGGWFSAPYGMGVQYTDPRGNSVTPWGEAEDTEVYAYWIDSALEFVQTKVNTENCYIVSAGAQIALLSEVTIPATYNGLPVLMIAGNAFKDCTNLKVLNIPSTLKQISVVSPFTGCNNLEAINVYDVEGTINQRYWSADGVLFDNGTGDVAQPKLAVMPLAKSGEYRIPDGVSEIPERAFANSQLTKVIIPADVQKIGKEAFAGSTKLNAVVFETARNEKGLTINARAFSGCTALTSIVLPTRLEKINLDRYSLDETSVDLSDIDNAFAGCNALKSITVASGNKNYKSVDGVLYSGDGKTLIYCPSFKAGSFVVPAGTIAIAPGAFIGCSSLTEISFPNTVTLIGECAFYGVSASLEKITFGGNGFNDVIVDKYAFRGCSALKEVVMESGSRVTTLGEGAFMDCRGLETFAIPNTMSSIGYEAFKNCTGLQSITFAANGRNLAFGENVFYNCISLTRVDLPANVSKIPGIFGGCTALTEVNVAEDSPYFTSEEGVVFNKEKTEVLFFPQGKVGNYTLPSTVTTVANGVFANITGLNKLTLSATVTSIGENAFRNCQINEIVFGRGKPEGGLTIGKSAFEGATVRKITLPDHTVSIGDNAFYGITFEEIVLKEGIETLGAYAFYGAVGTKTITVPASVTTIGDYCFAAVKDGFNVNGVKVELTTKNSQLSSIGKYAFAYNTNLKKIVIPASVVSIGDFAYYTCTDGAEILFEGESSLKTIGAHAFDTVGTNSNYNLTTVTIPKSVTSIGSYAFYGCTYLETVYFEAGGTEDLVLGNVYVYNYKDYNDMATKQIQHGYVFADCKELKSVDFPARLVEIAPHSFHSAAYYNEDGLVINFEENSRLQTIGEYAFYSCNLSSITIPKTVCNLDPYVNDSIGYSYDRMGIGAYAFAGNYDTMHTVTFEKGGTEGLTIGQNAFANADLLISVEFPARLTSYTSYTGETYGPFANGCDVFNDAENLQSITIEAGGTGYADVDGVVYTADLKELIMCPMAKSGAVEVPGTVTKIHDRAFFSCTKLTAITMVGGSQPMTIGNEVFKYCSGIKEIVLPSNVISLGENVFAAHSTKGSALESITLSKNLQNFNGDMITNCHNLKAIHVEEGSAYFSSDNGVLYSADKTRLICCPINFAAKEYTILPTVIMINPYAFSGNKNLEQIRLPAGLLEIQAYAFFNANSLNTIVIPNTVTLIAERAFSGCYSLSGLAFETGGTSAMVIGQYAFYSISTRSLTLPATVADIGNSAFYDSQLQNITIESGSKLKSLGNQVFRNAPLKNITLPDSLTTIGSNVFMGCASLESVTFGEGLISIGANNFQDSSVENVHFPASMQSMGIENFKDCRNLKEVTFAAFAKLAALPEGTFAGSSIERIIIPASVTQLADGTVSKGVFAGCTNLAYVGFADGSKCAVIGKYAFYNCTALKDMSLPLTISTLGESAFEHCGLVSIMVPAGATQLGSSLFASCENLTNVTLYTRTTELPTMMFANCVNLTSVVLPASVSTIGNSCFVNTGIESFEVAEGSTTMTSLDGVIYSADMTRVIAYPDKKKDPTLTIPGTVTYIGAGIFKENRYLEEIIFAEGTEELVIGEDAFRELPKLTKVHLPARLVAIEEGAFVYCKNLMYINVPASLTKESIAERAFYGCERLLEIYNESDIELTIGDSENGYLAAYALNIYTPTSGESKVITDENGFVKFSTTVGDREAIYLVAYNGSETEVVIPAYFTDIYKGVFNGMDITKVIIPEGVKTIGDEAFRACKALKEVQIPSTVESIGQYAFYTCESLVQVVIPASVNTMAYAAFRYCYNTLFLIAQPSEPAHWANFWISDESPVVWNYDAKERTYRFETNGGEQIESVKTALAVEVPTPVRAGYVFMGWFDNAKLTGDVISGAYYSTSKTTLYAKWMSQADFDAIIGTDYNNAIELTSGVPVTITVDEPGEYVYLRFTNTSSTAYGNVICEGASVQVCAKVESKYDTVYFDNVAKGIDFFVFDGDNYILIYLDNSKGTDTFTITLTVIY